MGLFVLWHGSNERGYTRIWRVAAWCFLVFTFLPSLCSANGLAPLFGQTGIEEVGFVNVTLCYFRFEDEDSYIYSPGYPGRYPPFADCAYELVRPSKAYCGVKLFMERLELEYDLQDPYCRRDYLEVLSCVPVSSARFCTREVGTSYQYVFQENAVSLKLRFVSDGSFAGFGFRIRYQMLQVCSGPYFNPTVSIIKGLTNPREEQPVCYSRIKDFEGTIFTPGYPNAYLPNMDCIYEFHRRDPFICGVKMTSEVFELDAPLKVPEGLSACTDFFQTPSCGFICGASNISWVARFQPGATSLRFHFHSDEAGEKRGFFIKFAQTYECLNIDV